MANSTRKRKSFETVIRVGQQGTVYQQKSYQTKVRAHGTTQESSEEYEEVIVDRSVAEIVDQINKRVKSPYYSLYCGIAGIALFYINGVLGFLVLLVAAALYPLDIRRKTTPLRYEFADDYSERRFLDGIAIFSNLATTHKTWRLKSQVRVEDWKRNAGSNSKLVRQQARVGKRSPNLIKTNIEVWGIDAGSIKFYLLPDRLFVFQDGVYSAIAYDELETGLKDLDYVEQDGLPKDATVVGQTWKYVRRDGGPDRRFKNNRQLPIVNYPIVVFMTDSLTAYLIVSSHQVADAFTQSFMRLLNVSGVSVGSGAAVEIASHASLPQENISIDAFQPLIDASDRGLTLSTSQLAELLSISNSVITKNSHSFEYEGFRFTRAGKLGRQIAWKVEKLPA